MQRLSLSHSIIRVIAILCALSLMRCVGAQNNQASQPGQNDIVYGLSISVSGIDPHINQSMELGIVLRQVYDTLIYRHPETREFVPGLAASWSVSPDGLVYTFDLKSGVVFHDGEPFNAQAVATNIERIMAPETGSQRARLLLGSLQRYEIVDNDTIRLILSEPYSPLLDGLSQVYVGMASPRALAEYSLLRYQYHQVGTGPFRFVEYLPEDRIVIERWDEYNWGPDFYSDRGNIHRIEYRFFRDSATRSVALENNQAQVMGELLPLDARTLTNDVDFTIAPVAIPGQPLQFYMNTRKAPLDQLAVRQALLFATNRSSIVDVVYQGFSPVAWGPLAAVTDYYNPQVVGLYNYDPAQASTLLESAGYADTDNDGILDLNGEPLSITVIQPAWGLVPEVTQLLLSQWQALGIKVDVVPVPGFTALIERVESGEYHLVAFDTPGLDPSLLNARFQSNGPANWTGYGSSELDATLLDAVRQADPQIRRQLYGQAQIIIMREALILPIRDYVNLNGYASNLQNLIFDPYGWFPLMYGVIRQ